MKDGEEGLRERPLLALPGTMGVQKLPDSTGAPTVGRVAAYRPAADDQLAPPIGAGARRERHRTRGMASGTPHHVSHDIADGRGTGRRGDIRHHARVRHQHRAVEGTCSKG